MPTIMITLTGFQSVQKHVTLQIVAASFLAMKTLEFSARRMLDEMVRLYLLSILIYSCRS